MPTMQNIVEQASKITLSNIGPNSLFLTRGGCAGLAKAKSKEQEGELTVLGDKLLRIYVDIASVLSPTFFKS
jgi:hypothetical protein